MDNVNIRPVAASDAEAICRIYNRYVTDTTISFETEPLSIGAMRRRIETIAGECPYLVCEVAGEVVGFCYVHPWKERAAYGMTMETTVYISPSYHRRGIGRLMMTELISECRRRGYHSLIACITADNDASCSMHAALGFKQVSRFEQVGMKFGRLLDVVDMELIL